MSDTGPLVGLARAVGVATMRVLRAYIDAGVVDVANAARISGDTRPRVTLAAPLVMVAGCLAPFIGIRGGVSTVVGRVIAFFG